CASCHGNGTRLGGFSIDSREAIITGGANHPAVVPGKSSESYLIKLVSGAVPGKIMPLQGPRLTPAEIGKLKAWIDAGLPFDDGVKSSAWKPILAPRKPALPPVPAGTNLTSPIDRLLTPYYKANKVPPRPLVGDRTFARRAYLDIVGLLPDPEALRAFVEDQRPDKRERLVRRLLDDKKNYAEHWLTFWNDLLRNDYTGTGYIDGGRKPITGWLYAALQDNMPYDRFVSQLVNPTPETEGFTNGIIWRGVVNASQTPQMQAAQNISQVFMGVNLKCASCHNSFINDWKLADAYGMAGIYADKALEMVRCDQPTGEVAPIKFLYPELGTIDADAPKRQRMEKLAEILTGKQNGRLTRTFVNRIWTRLMGRGLIEPNDEMDHPPWNADLLDWLAADFADNGYDVKRLIGQIVTSKAYQLPSSGLPSEDVKEFVFRGPVRKRLSAEQFVDAASTLTDVWQKPAVNGLRIVKGAPVLPAGGRAALKWASEVMRSGAAEVDVDLAGAETLALIATDAGDGQSYDWANWVEPRLTGPKGEIRLTDLAWRTGTTGYGKIQKDRSIVEKPLRLGEKTYAWGIGTHANSILTYWLPQGVTRFRATVGPDSGSLEESKVSNAKPSVRFFVVTGDGSLTESRASMAVADPLMTALGRPNREQTVTQRASAATTLQALELTNGETLAAMIRQGAEKAVKERGKNAPQLIRDLYARALSRPPTPEEEKMALKVAGSPVSASGVEDLLWGLMMLPEFQLY
ncbi:MAG: DUF1553 domain-containing protein, partial [Armatimonadetes bacterium]|nr:DUF1553 domain-containing protein [Armatimonadota bacterium]